jgi:hypothetical protein
MLNDLAVAEAQEVQVVQEAMQPMEPMAQILLFQGQDSVL